MSDRDGVPVTRRQRLAELLAMGWWGFTELRRELGMSVSVLVADLDHLERSLRAAGKRLRMQPARCPACGFVFRQRKRFSVPSRCPKCREERIEEPRLSVS